MDKLCASVNALGAGFGYENYFGHQISTQTKLPLDLIFTTDMSKCAPGVLTFHELIIIYLQVGIRMDCSVGIYVSSAVTVIARDLVNLASGQLRPTHTTPASAWRGKC